jgi:hypothetical protein
MMLPFDPGEDLIVVPARVLGSGKELIVRLALDTGATSSMLNWDIAVNLGYDPSAAPNRVHTTTGSGIEMLPSIIIRRFESLGHAHTDFPILLPPTTDIDGVLGLDFFRGRKLTIDFRIGLVTLE